MDRPKAISLENISGLRPRVLYQQCASVFVVCKLSSSDEGCRMHPLNTTHLHLHLWNTFHDDHAHLSATRAFPPRRVTRRRNSAGELLGLPEEGCHGGRERRRIVANDSASRSRERSSTEDQRVTATHTKINPNT